jgi:hypothetical protein
MHSCLEFALPEIMIAVIIIVQCSKRGNTFFEEAAMRKFVLSVIVAGFVLGLVGCGEETKKTEKTATTTTVTAGGSMTGTTTTVK